MLRSARTRVPAAAAVVLAAAVVTAPAASATTGLRAQDEAPVAHPLQIPGVIFSEKCSASQFPQLPTIVTETSTRNYFPGSTTATVRMLGGEAGAIPLLGSFTVYWFNLATLRGGQSTAPIGEPSAGVTTGYTGLDTGSGPVALTVAYNVSGVAAGGTPCTITPALGLTQVG